ncbi:hypothetical protein [Roseomonas sp. WA12]
MIQRILMMFSAHRVALAVIEEQDRLIRHYQRGDVTPWILARSEERISDLLDEVNGW